jgi:hypothetical protein
MRPDALLFESHVKEGDFQYGVNQGMWAIIDPAPGFPAWPDVLIWVAAAPKLQEPDRFYFRFNLSGYPQVAPTATPWDLAGNRRLDNNRWPKGPQLVSRTFNHTWNPNALYAPCDRVAMVGHDPWKQQYPELWWQSSFRITVYLNFIYRLLHSSDYARS